MTITYNALSGALAAQAAINAASQNIANVMTPGYTRQGALLASVQHSASRQSPGDGVTVSSIVRYSDEYKNLQLWQAASSLGEHSAPQPYFTQIEQVAGNDAASINSGLDGFFGALNAASVEPTSGPLRKQAIIAADALSQRFNSFRQVLSDQQAAINQQRQTAVDQINLLSKDIAELNQKITEMSSANISPSGLMDARDQKIDALANLVGVQILNQPDGTRSVLLRDGPPLVVGGKSATVNVINTPGGPQKLKLTFATETFTLSSGNLRGQLGGVADYETKVLAPLTQSVIDMARGVATLVNNQLAAGFDVSGAPGKPLFNFVSSSASSLLTVQPGVLPDDLAFSAKAGEPGNSDNLLLLIGQKDQSITVSSLGTVLLRDAYTQLVGKLGMDSQQNQVSMNTAKTIRDQADANWKSTSGVNNDEEAMNLIQYQQMYQANMKVIAVTNQLFDSTLAMFG